MQFFVFNFAKLRSCTLEDLESLIPIWLLECCYKFSELHLDWKDFFFAQNTNGWFSRIRKVGRKQHQAGTQDLFFPVEVIGASLQSLYQAVKRAKTKLAK